MTIRVAINGFGRIGRMVFRSAYLKSNIDIIAINDLSPIDNLRYLLKYDSTHGRFKNYVEIENNCFVIDGRKTECFSEREPINLPWDKLNVDFVIESTGLFTSREKAEGHLKAGAKKVILSAPAKSSDINTFVMGVNNEKYNAKTDNIVSN